VRFCGLRLRIPQGQVPRADLLLVKNAKDRRRQNRFWKGAEFDDGDRQQGQTGARSDPQATRLRRRPRTGVLDREPAKETITVLTLVRGAYIEHGVFRRGETATSLVLPGFSVSVDAVFDAT